MSVKNKLSKEYMRGDKPFVDKAKDYVNKEGKIRCPCRKCLNRSFQPLEIVKSHLVRNGIQQSYKVWSLHGEFLMLDSLMLKTERWSLIREYTNFKLINL